MTRTKFRYIGTTDDVIECEQCGKPNLRSTVVIMPLDAEGNDDGEPVYYGSVCAARALAVRGGGKAVRQSASGARVRTLMAAHDARRMLRLYGLPEAGELEGAALITACMTYAKFNPGAARTALGINDMIRHVNDMLARKRAAIHDAVLVAGEDWANDRQPIDYGYGAEIKRYRAEECAV